MVNIGIIGPSEIALRRFLPALHKLNDFKYIGVAIANEMEWASDSVSKQSNLEKIYKVEKDKASQFIDGFGGKVFESYTEMIHSNEIDAIYLPLPPALHYKWASIAIKAGKHVLIEKPSTVSLNETKDLIRLAKQKNVALHENYMFVYHNQLDQINNIIKSGKIGNVRLYRMSFGFPRRASNDFRYNKVLGGGALLDCGGYTLKYAAMLLGDSVKILCAQSNFINEFDVDISGSATLINDQNITAQVAFGMDNSYKCDLEVWGSVGCLSAGRIFTAPEGFIPKIKIVRGNIEEIIDLSHDDTFKKSISHFHRCIIDKDIREMTIKDMAKQSELIETFYKRTFNV